MFTESRMFKKFGDDYTGVVSAQKVGKSISLFSRDGRDAASVILSHQEAIELAEHLLSISINIATEK